MIRNPESGEALIVARAMIAPRIGPIHGAHTAPRLIPNRKGYTLSFE